MSRINIRECEIELVDDLLLFHISQVNTKYPDGEYISFILYPEFDAAGGCTLGIYSNEWIQIEDMLRVEEHEKIAQFVEVLAHHCDQGTIVECWKKFEGLNAYKRWAAGVLETAGITLRQPQLSKIYHLRVPPNIRSGKRTRPCYGDLIPIQENPPAIGNRSDFCTSARDDLLLIADEEKNILSHKRAPGQKSSMQKVVENYDFNTTSPSLFNRENADRMLERLNKFLPECQWKIVMSTELAVDLVGQGFSS